MCREKVLPDAKSLPADELWRMKRDAQSRDHKLAAQDKFARGQNLLIQPDVARQAEVIWPPRSLR